MIKVTDIRELRKAADCSQWGLAKATGIDRSRLSLMECGYVEPSAAELEKIEQALLTEVRQLSMRLEQVLRS
ncbi:MAG: helix-turn-helix transcriptional regulator [Terriglobales bacterium]|jgi:transcriptional regulator with XRE-family HTH domain